MPFSSYLFLISNALTTEDRMQFLLRRVTFCSLKTIHELDEIASIVVSKVLIVVIICFVVDFNCKLFKTNLDEEWEKIIGQNKF